MRNNVITMSFYNEKISHVQTASYEFKPYGRFAFVQKMLWKALHKFGALKLYWEPKVEVKRININTKDFGKRLLEYYHKSFPDNNRPTKVYMGPNEYCLLASMHPNEFPAFTFDIEMNYGRKLFNLPVTVVPHMNGVLIV